MKFFRLNLIVLLPILPIISGCQATRTSTRKVGKAAVAIPRIVVNAIIDGILDSDETIIEREERERQEQRWKQHWRDHPTDNQAMHEAFKDDYQ